MQKNHALLESSDIARHFMTSRERRTKKALCQLLIDKGHRKYAERFWKLDFNIVDSKKHPDFTAAISFDDATVFVSDGFLGSGQGIFNQLDVLLRHEMAHNLMMHQIRLMHVFKQIHADNPDEAYEHIRYSASLHEILNCIEDFEISNKRYTTEDKKIVRTMQLNGEVIGGLVTEDHRDAWKNLSLEAMYDELSKELIKINSDIRSDPNWSPIKDGTYADMDLFKVRGARMINSYKDVTKPSGIRAPMSDFIVSKSFKSLPELYQNFIKQLFNAFKDFESEQDIDLLLDIIQDIAETAPQEEYVIIDPKTNKKICTLYTPEDKMFASQVLKNLSGNINYNPLRFKVKRKINPQEYKDTWNAVVKKLDSKGYSNKDLAEIRAIIENA